jgi:DNA polymerase-3 subunit alpha
MAFVTIDDRSGRIEVTLFGDTYARYHDVLGSDKVIVVNGEVRHDDYAGGLVMRVNEVYDMERAREQYARRLLLEVPQEQAVNGLVPALTRILTPFREGGCPITLDYTGDGAAARVNLGRDWLVRPSDELLSRLRALLGEERVRVEYR